MCSHNCDRCDSSENTEIFRLIGVSVESSSTTRYGLLKDTTTTHIREELMKAQKVCLCRTCVGKAQIKVALKEAFSGFIAAAAVMLIIFLLDSRKSGHLVFPYPFLLVFAGATAVICFISVLFWPDSRIVGKSMAEDSTEIYVPIDPKLYTRKGSNEPDLATFRRITRLKTKLGADIFDAFIYDDNGIEMIDSILSKKEYNADIESEHSAAASSLIRTLMRVSKRS